MACLGWMARSLLVTVISASDASPSARPRTRVSKQKILEQQGGVKLPQDW